MNNQEFDQHAIKATILALNDIKGPPVEALPEVYEGIARLFHEIGILPKGELQSAIIAADGIRERLSTDTTM